MKRHLLDVNVLLALVWPRHEGHHDAHAWFARVGRRAWATNPITQLGVLRLLTNSLIALHTVSPARALDVMAEATRHPGHEFWPMDRQVLDSLKPLASYLRGYHQWTDAALLCHAAEHDAALVTFDSGIAELASPELRNRVVLLRDAR
jgi:toxin-antitoxin system PIN domain toxin